MIPLLKLKSELRRKASSKRAEILQRFFKTGKGEYGEGDIFLGITVPETRKIAKKYSKLDFQDIKKLLKSKIHEERLLGILIMVNNFERGEKIERKKIFDFYLKNTKYINNWDLVDLSANKIVGAHLLCKPRKILYGLAKSRNIWERRVSIIATFHFIKNNQFEDTLKISEILINDKHDLIHKATGWMLRETGKKSQIILERFLNKHSKKMPKTMLRYAIERFPKNKRIKYLKKINL